MGSPKYPADFKHFNYVNPNAPKGGLVRLGQDGTFDTLNFVIPRGTAAAGITLIYDTLMTSALDEVATEYGLLAEAVSHPPDWSSVTYRLRKEARWHDGKPVTPEDVVWSFQTLVKLNPNQGFYYRHVKKAEQTGDREVTFTFDGPGNRELPQIVGQISVLPKHYWTGTDAQGRQRDINAGTLEPPLGSGPYRIKNVVPGRTIAYERVPDYWGAKFRRKSERTISTRSVSSTSATTPSSSRRSRRINTISASSRPRATGRPLMIFRRSEKDALYWKPSRSVRAA